MNDTFDHETDDCVNADDDQHYDIGWVCPICDTWYPSSMLSCSFCTPNQEDYLDHE